MYNKTKNKISCGDILCLFKNSDEYKNLTIIGDGIIFNTIYINHVSKYITLENNDGIQYDADFEEDSIIYIKDDFEPDNVCIHKNPIKKEIIINDLIDIIIINKIPDDYLIRLKYRYLDFQTYTNYSILLTIDEIFFIISDDNKCEHIFFTEFGLWTDLRSIGYKFKKLL